MYDEVVEVVYGRFLQVVKERNLKVDIAGKRAKTLLEKLIVKEGVTPYQLFRILESIPAGSSFELYELFSEKKRMELIASGFSESPKVLSGIISMLRAHLPQLRQAVEKNGWVVGVVEALPWEHHKYAGKFITGDMGVYYCYSLRIPPFHCTDLWKSAHTVMKKFGRPRSVLKELRTLHNMALQYVDRELWKTYCEDLHQVKQYIVDEICPDPKNGVERRICDEVRK